MRYRHGTDRLVPPAITLARIASAAEAAGIVRVAEVTGLDTIGIPVFQAIRPAARSLAVSQGKGVTRAAARVSAIMEAIELDRAERRAADVVAAMRSADAAFCLALAPGLDPDRLRGWCAATDLLSGAALRVPHALVGMDFTLPLDDGLRPSSNGLASGNDRDEATVAALCELLERDDHARWLALEPAARRASAIVPASIDDRLGACLIGKVRQAGLALWLWRLSGDDPPVTIGCAIVDPARGTPTLPPVFGAGTHLRRGVALARAITEAAQVRATLIAGARDDLMPADYADPAAARLRFLLELGGVNAGCPWRDVPDGSGQDTAALARLLDACRTRGVPAVARVDLSRGGEALAVVKLLVPGLAGRRPHLAGPP